MLVREILQATKGRLLSGNPKADINLKSISTDSRVIKKGEFFLPLKGNNFDGEEFIADAFGRGAIGAFVVRRSPAPPIAKLAGSFVVRDKIIIQVKDTTEALQRIAHAHRMKFKIPVIGVTGSNGKTTAKDMISHVLSAKFNVLKNEGTKNNHIGVPQALLKLDKRHEICVLEMGANHKGEIRLLADIARPDIAAITNIGPSHLEFLKDLRGVSRAKKEILEFLGRNSLVVINGDDRYLSGLKNKAFDIIRFGMGEKNDFRASIISAGTGHVEFLLNGKEKFVLNILGAHNIYNALIAIAIGRHFKLSAISIREALARYRPAYMRLNIKDIGGITVIDDAYNSNPSSMQCALKAMKDLPANAKWIVSADMLELGKREDDFHRMMGESIARLGFNGLITFGPLSRHTYDRAIECGADRKNSWHCRTHREVAGILRKVAKKGDAILIKGSRAMKMEEVIEKLSCKL